MLMTPPFLTSCSCCGVVFVLFAAFSQDKTRSKRFCLLFVAFVTNLVAIHENWPRANPLTTMAATTSSAVIFSWRCKKKLLLKWSTYSARLHQRQRQWQWQRQQREWFDLSSDLATVLGQTLACVAVKSAFLRDNLNADVRQVCNLQPVSQSLAICQLGLRISCSLVVWCADLPPEVRLDGQRTFLFAAGVCLILLDNRRCWGRLLRKALGQQHCPCAHAPYPVG